MTSVDIVTVHFNPAGFDRRRETYYEWLPALGRWSDRVRCIELVFDDDEPEIEGSTVICGTRERNLMWQKEALINIALAESMANCFVWIDHDLVFPDESWVERGIEAIKRFPAVQLFDNVRYIDLDGQFVRELPGCKGGMIKHGSNPGGAWMADRRWLQSVGGLPTHKICGGGDRAFVYDHIEDVGWIAGEVTHLWHGDLRRRQYGSRYGRLKRAGLADDDFRIGANGLLEWTRDKPAVRAAMAEFFAGRREDDPTVLPGSRK